MTQTQDPGLRAHPPQDSTSITWKKQMSPTVICIVVLFCAVAAIAAPAQSIFFTSLANFDFNDGAYTSATLVQGADGNFYGTTAGGGYCGYCGTVFKITPAGELTTLYFFGGLDGLAPTGALLQGSDGDFYGTTKEGGPQQRGTVFRITPDGALTTLYQFCILGYSCTDGGNPFAGLVRGGDGSLYSTTAIGGISENCPFGCGTIFRITTEGEQTTLYSFANSDGASPFGGLVKATDGNFYGTTRDGGLINEFCIGCGTIFKITPQGVLTTLHKFCSQPNCVDGASPYAGMVQGNDGNLYGTTGLGGAGGWGTVFKITLQGELTTLHAFCSEQNCADGAFPQSDLLAASDGHFYGTTIVGGVGYGTVFRITSSGILNTVHSFGVWDGAEPIGGLVQARDGALYGTTTSGASYDYGNVFRLGVVRTCAACRP